MVSSQVIIGQLKKIGFNPSGWGRTEVNELQNIILPDEEIYECVNGYYEGGFALLLASDVRVLLVDKKPLKFLTVEDLRFDMINEIDYNHTLSGAYISISAGNKNLTFRSWNKKRLRILISHVQRCMAEAKKKQSTHQEGQVQHLEAINQQLQTYLLAQLKQQQDLQQKIMSVPQPDFSEPKTSHLTEPDDNLKDWLYAQGLIERYQQESGQKLAMPPDQAPTIEKMQDLYKSAKAEIFGGASSQTEPLPDSGKIHGALKVLEINPAKIVLSKLPAVLKSRRELGRLPDLPRVHESWTVPASSEPA